MPKDDEIVEIVAFRLEARDPVDLLIKLDPVLQRHGYQIKAL